MNNKIKFAIVGAGHIGKRHAAMVSKNPDCELMALCDIAPRDSLGLEDYDVPFFQKMVDMLQQVPDIDVVSICTPNGLHAEQSMIALDARKHVVCEKPMALNRSDCEKVIYKALNVSRHVFCVMQNRYSPPSEWLKKVVDDGLLGKIQLVEINCYWNRDDRYYYKDSKLHPWKGTRKLDGGTLFTQFSHFIDIMYWLFGDIKHINGRLYDFKHQESTEFEDTGVINFHFVNGGTGCLTYSTAVWGQNLESSMTIIGEKGSVKVGGQYMNDVVECNIEGYEMPELPPANPANFYGHYWGSAANHHYIFENVAEVLHHEKEATTNALEGMKVVDIIERIYDSAERFFPEKTTRTKKEIRV